MTDDLLDLVDTVSRLADRASDAMQYGVKTRLEAILPILIEAAKCAALSEIQDRRAT